jgi:hypothetical protein
VDVAHITRKNRVGFKAGALAAGTAQAKGDLIAIFDADFMPEPDFLRRVVPHLTDPSVGCVQTRWGHVNRDYSLLTRAQALGIDGHFVVQQTARSRAGLFLNFNGTAGIWRRACIEDADGWRADTLTEDLELSYRAQLRGWRIVYLPDVVVPAELPAQISAFKRQQARWAQGSMQTAIKMMGPLFRSAQPLRVKLEGALHLTGYAVHPLMLMLILLTIPMSFSRSWVVVGLPWLMITAAGPPLLYIASQMAKDQGGGHRLLFLPLLTVLGMGLSLSNSSAVARAVLGIQHEFQRTPKFDLRRAADSWVGSEYALPKGWLVWVELGLAILAGSTLFLPNTRWSFAPWLLLYTGGFSFVAGLNLYQMFERRRWLARQPRSTAGTRAGIQPNGRPRIRAS